MRGGISYVTLMVLNPIIILFYQNCSFLPSERALADRPGHHLTTRAPASVLKVQGSGACNEARSICKKPIE